MNDYLDLVKKLKTIELLQDRLNDSLRANLDYFMEKLFDNGFFTDKDLGYINDMFDHVNRKAHH